MKIYIVSFLAIAALASSALAQVAVGPGSVKLGKVDVEGVKSPEYQIVGGPQKRSKTGTWLEVEISSRSSIKSFFLRVFAMIWANITLRIGSLSTPSTEVGIAARQPIPMGTV